MENFSAISSYVLVLSVITVLFMVLLLRQQRSSKDLPIWLLSTIAGVLLGAAGSAALVKVMGYDIGKELPPVEESERSKQVDPSSKMGPPGGKSEGAPGGGATGGGGGMGAMGGGRGGGGPPPKMQLTSLVRKLALLTGEIEIQLSPEQAADVNKVLGEIQSAEKMTDDEAKAIHEQLLALLTDDQKAKQEAIGLPFSGGGGRGGGGGGGGMGMMGKGGPPQPNDTNPFTTDNNKDALESLRARLGGASTESSDATASTTTTETATP